MAGKLTIDLGICKLAMLIFKCLKLIKLPNDYGNFFNFEHEYKYIYYRHSNSDIDYGRCYKLVHSVIHSYFKLRKSFIFYGN